MKSFGLTIAYLMMYGGAIGSILGVGMMLHYLWSLFNG